MSWRRTFLLTLLFAVLIGVATWQLLLRTDAMTKVLEAQLADLLGPPVRLEQGSLDISQGRIALLGLRIGDPAQPQLGLAELQQLECEVSTSLQGEILAPQHVALRGLHVTLGPELPSLATLLPNSQARSPQGRALPLPSLELVDGSIDWELRAGHAKLQLRQVRATLTPDPTAPNQLLVALSATHAATGLCCELTGRIQADNGKTECSVRLRETALPQHALEQLSQALGFADSWFGLPWHQVTAAAHLKHGVAHAQFDPTAATGSPLAYSVDLELAQVQCDAAELPYPVHSATLHAQATTAAGGSLRATLTQATAQGALELQVAATLTDEPRDPDLELRLNGRGVAIDAELDRLLTSLPIGREILAALQPHGGDGDVALYLRNPHRPVTETELDLTVRGVAAAYHGFGKPDQRIGFPLPLRNTQGRVVLRDGVVQLRDFTAEIAAGTGTGRVTLAGMVEPRKATGEDVSLDIHVQGVPFGPELQNALAALMPGDDDLYGKLSPQGLADVTVQVRPTQELPGNWSARIDLQGAQVCWAGFPYRLEHVAGRLDARDEGVAFDLSGQREAGQWRLQGNLPLSGQVPGEAQAFAAGVRFRNVNLDAALHEAATKVVPELAAVWRAWEPSGSISGEVRLQRDNPLAPIRYDLRLQCEQTQITLPMASWYAEALQGQVIAQGTGAMGTLQINNLNGLLRQGTNRTPLALFGHVAVGDNAHSDLSFTARGLPIDMALGNTLETMQAISSGTWNLLQPGGHADVVCRHRTESGQQPRTELAAELIDASCAAPFLPHPARAISGELAVRDGALHFTGIHATLADAEVTLDEGLVAAALLPQSGTQPALSATKVAFTVRSRGFPLDAGLGNLFAEPLRSTIAARRLAGRAEIAPLRLELLIPTADSGETTTSVSGRVRLLDAGVSLGSSADALRLDGLTGVLTLDPATVRSAQGSLTGQFERGTLVVLGHRITNMASRFQFDHQELLLSHTTGAVHGGTLRAGPEPAAPLLRYRLPSAQAADGSMDLDLDIANFDLRSFLLAAGMVNPTYSGNASCQLQLRDLQGDRLVDAKAVLQCKVERGDLGAVPLFTAIYSQLPEADQPRFHSVQAKAILADQKVTLRELAMASNLLKAEGKGELTLDGYLDIELKLDNLLGQSSDPLLLPLISLLAKNIVRFHLAGPLRDLRAVRRWVTQEAPPRRGTPPLPPLRTPLVLPDY